MNRPTEREAPGGRPGASPAGEWAAAAVGALALVVAAPPPAAGQSPVGGEDVRLDLGGYVRSLTGVHDAGFDVPGTDRRSAFNSEVARLEWSADLGDRVRLQVHDRLQVRVSTHQGGLGRSVAGFGVSASPGRAVDLQSELIDDDRLSVTHDVERLAATVYTPVADVTLGRQAITWGTSLLFPVTDLWARFSPYELDTAEKPGVDALRALAYPAAGLELDAVVADRGERDAVSAGLRATLSLPAADLYVAGGRMWDEALAAAGVTWLLETVKLRAEAVAARDVDTDRWLDPRVTVGVDRIGGTVTVSGELHYNGLGAEEPSGYLARLQSDTFARGESYYLGRLYAGLLAGWTLDRAERLRLEGTALVNLEDGSSALSPALTWDLGQATTLSLGALVTFGDPPALRGGVPELRSEYGTYGDLGYTRLSLYF